MKRIGFLLSLVVAMVVVCGGNVCAAIGPADPTDYFVTYYSNANIANAPDATVRIINDGFTEATLWADFYVFDDSEELVECCACMVTPDGLLSESVKNDLTATPLTGIKPTRGVIKVISSNNDDPTAPAPMPGLREWATHVQKLASGFAVTEGEAAESNLAASEESLLGELCLFSALLSGHPCQCTQEDQNF